jgi:uncharacterized protein involved in outer membrane biogenesis
MKKLLGFIRNLILFAVIVLILLVVFREPVLKVVVSDVASRITGFSVSTDKLQIGLARPVIHITGLKVYNPNDFSEKTMLDMPEVYVHYDPLAIFRNEVSLTELRIDLKEFIVVKNKEGQTNVARLKGVSQKPADSKAAQKGASKAPVLKIDFLRLDIGEVVYKDFTVDPASTKTYKIDVHKEYRNISDPAHLIQVIVLDCLLKANIRGLSDVDLSSIKDNAKSVLSSGKQVVVSATKTAVGAAGKAVGSAEKKVAGTLKAIFH